MFSYMSLGDWFLLSLPPRPMGLGSGIAGDLASCTFLPYQVKVCAVLCVFGRLVSHVPFTVAHGPYVSSSVSSHYLVVGVFTVCLIRLVFCCSVPIIFSIFFVFTGREFNCFLLQL